MRFLDKLSIPVKLATAFGILVTALLLVAAVGIYSINTAYSTFVEYRSLARQANSDGRVQANMLSTRVFVKDFVIDPTDESIAGVQERAAATIELIVEARELAQDSVYEVLLESMNADLNEYVSYFTQVTELQSQRNELVLETLNVVGPIIEQDLTGIMQSAVGDGDTEAAYLAGLAVRSLLLGRLYANRFLVQNDESAYERAVLEFRNMDRDLETLDESLENIVRRELLQDAISAKELYFTALEQVHTVILERNNIIDNRLDRIGPRVAEEIEELKLAIQADQDALGPIAQRNLNASQSLTLAITFFAAIIGIGFAIVISRAILTPLRSITLAADAFSTGQIDVDVNTNRNDEIGRLARAFVAMRDSIREKVSSLESEITERTKAESEAAERRQVFMDSSVPIIIEDLNGVITDANQEAIRSYGYLREELIGQPIKILVPEEFHDQADQLLRESRMGNEVRDIEGVRCNRLQERIPVELTFFQLRDTDGRITAIVTIAKDISRQKEEEASRQLAESQAAFQRQVFMDSSVPIIIEDLDGIITDANQEAIKTYGYLREELIGQPIKILVPPEFHEQADELLQLSRRGEDVRNAEGVRWNKRHEYLPVELTFSHLTDNEGRITALATIAKDISKQKEIQNALDEEREGLERTVEERTVEVKEAMKRAEELRDQAEAATKAKANFLATMSHEIRTPMNGIIGMVDLLRQSSLSSEHQKMLQTISESGYSLITIINDILDFSKVEAGKLEIESIPYNLLDLVEGVVANLGPIMQEKGLKVTMFVDPLIPQSIMGDPVRVRQILMNLGSNAVKFSDHGEVEFRAEYIPGAPGSAPELCFRVLDDGIGISADAQKKLFTAFDQAETSTTRKYGGTGLGLSICKRLSELMDGRIQVNSSLGEGSEFIVNLPLIASEKQIDIHRESNLQGLRILLFSSDKKQLEICRTYLEHWQASVEVSDNLDEVNQTIQKKTQILEGLDLVVLGSGWGREDQIALRDDIHAQKGTENLKVILLMQGRRSHARLDNPETITLDVNPLKRIAFLNAVAIATGRASPEAFHVEEIEDFNVDVEPLSVNEAMEKNALILVAEDNPTNQDVVKRQLNMLGYTCEMADNGVEALRHWRKGRASILLTDCHMPEMDGYTLAETIRSEEKVNGSPRAPIVAITANALQGEAQRCMAHGMDDYLAKPLELKLLREKLRQWLPHFRPEPRNSIGLNDSVDRSEQNSSGVSSLAAVDCVDLSTLKGLIGDDEEILNEVLRDFISPSQKIVAELEVAYQSKNAEEVVQSSHKLKSSARSIGANGLADICQELEAAGKVNDMETIDSRMAELEGAFKDVVAYIELNCVPQSVSNVAES